MVLLTEAFTTALQRSNPPDVTTAGSFHYVDWVYIRATQTRGYAAKSKSIGGNCRGRDLVPVQAGRTSVLQTSRSVPYSPTKARTIRLHCWGHCMKPVGRGEVLAYGVSTRRTRATNYDDGHGEGTAMIKDDRAVNFLSASKHDDP